MREKRKFAERTRVLKSSETRRKVFLVYEGVSAEEIYFDALEKKESKLELIR